MESNKRFAGEKYNLRWNSHKSSLVHYLGDHLAQEELVDVTLACSGSYIKAHKLILSSCSTYFKELFQLHKVDNPMIIFNNVKFEDLKYVIDFIYNGEIRVQDSDLEGVLLLGNTLKIKGLSNISEKNLANKNNLYQQESISKNTQEEMSDSVVNEKHSDDERNSHKKTTIEQGSNKPVDNEMNFLEKGNILNPTDITHKNVQLPGSEMVQNLVTHKRETSNMNKKSYTSNNEMDVDTLKIKKRKITIIKDSQLTEKQTSKEDFTHPPDLPAPFSEIDGGNPLKVEVQEIVCHVIDPLDPASIRTDSSSATQVKPVSAFMIFANEWRKRLAVEHPHESNKQISVRLSNMWKNLSEETRDTFYEIASRAYAEQKQRLKGVKR